MGLIQTSALAQAPHGAVVLVDDDPQVLRAIQRTLERSEPHIEPYATAEAALQRLERGGVDVVVCDITLPGMTGIDLLRKIREREPDLPVVLMTGNPALESATAAIDYGVLKYLIKPIAVEALREAVVNARHLYRMACLKREALVMLTGSDGDPPSVRHCFDRALDSLWMAFQPLVRASDGGLFGYEALVRSAEAALPGPGDLLRAAERLGELVRLGRRVREQASLPPSLGSEQWLLFVNLHPEDLSDPELANPDSPLSRISERVVLEITERATLDKVDNVRERVRELRQLGFRIAVDDLGAGYAGLTSFALLEPEIVKLDMTLIRGIDQSPVKQKVVASMTALCHDMGQTVVAEGIETSEERAVLVEIGCDVLQGYLFAPPGPPFPAIRA